MGLVVSLGLKVIPSPVLWFFTFFFMMILSALYFTHKHEIIKLFKNNGAQRMDSQYTVQCSFLPHIFMHILNCYIRKAERKQ